VLRNVSLKDITKFQVQMLLNQLAADDYSCNVVYHVRDIIKAALAEAVDQEVLECNMARETVIPEMEERDNRSCQLSTLSFLRPRRPRSRYLSDRFVLRHAPQRNLWAQLGFVSRFHVQSHEYGLSRADSAEENQTQESLRAQ